MKRKKYLCCAPSEFWKYYWFFLRGHIFLFVVWYNNWMKEKIPGKYILQWKRWPPTCTQQFLFYTLQHHQHTSCNNSLHKCYLLTYSCDVVNAYLFIIKNQDDSLHSGMNRENGWKTSSHTSYFTVMFNVRWKILIKNHVHCFDIWKYALNIVLINSSLVFILV